MRTDEDLHRDLYEQGLKDGGQKQEHFLRVFFGGFMLGAFLAFIAFAALVSAVLP